MATLGRRTPRHFRLYGAAMALVAGGLLLSFLLATGSNPNGPKRFAVAVTAPLVEAGASVHGASESLWLSVFHSNQQQERIQELEQQLAMVHMESAAEQSRMALDTLAMDVSTHIPAGTFELVAAPVLLAPQTGGRQVSWIRGGHDEGFQPGMVVLGPSGIVGQIDEVYDTRSLVTLATDHKSAWGAELEDCGEIGLLRGTGKPGIAEFHFRRTAGEAQPGDTVVSTGMAGSLAPGGVPFGIVTEVLRNKNGELIALVQFAQEPEKLRTLFVLPIVRIPTEFED